MNNNNQKRKPAGLILGGAILAAAWMIGGPFILGSLNLPSKVLDVLVFAPSTLVVIGLVSSNQNFMACEYRAWRKILGKSD